MFGKDRHAIDKHAPSEGDDGGDIFWVRNILLMGGFELSNSQVISIANVEDGVAYYSQPAL